MEKILVYKELGIELDKIFEEEKDKCKILDNFVDNKYRKLDNVSNISISSMCKILLNGYYY